MKRIYFLVPNIETTRKLVDDLLLARIEERHIHVLARRGTPLEDLPEATFLQKSDFIPALEQGLLLGGFAGLVMGVVVVLLPTGLALGGGAILAMFLGGAVVGAWVSSMIGIGIGDRRLQQFEASIEKGAVLMMVDVPRLRVDKIEQIVKKLHPEADYKGLEPTIPPFP